MYILYMYICMYVYMEVSTERYTYKQASRICSRG